MPPTIHTYPENQGWILRLQKNREGVDLSLAYCFLLSYGRKTEKSNCIWITNVASHFQNWLFGYKSCVSFTNIHMSVTNIAFCFTKWHLGLLLSYHRQFGLDKWNGAMENGRNCRHLKTTIYSYPAYSTDGMISKYSFCFHYKFELNYIKGGKLYEMQSMWNRI